MKLLMCIFIYLAFCSPYIIYGQADIDTIISYNVIEKKIDRNEYVYVKRNDPLSAINNAFIVDYKQGCENSISTIKEIKDGKLIKTKRYKYFDNTCILSEMFYTTKGSLKIGKYTKWNLFGLKEVEGNFDINGNEDGIFKFYDYNKQTTFHIDYDGGKRRLKYTKEDSLNSEVKIKNIVSIDVLCLSIKELKIFYERYYKKKNIIKFEFDFKPSFAKEGTMVFNIFSKNPYISIVPSRYLFSIENQNLFGYKKHPFYLNRNPFYISYGLYYLYKSYNKIKFHYVMGDNSYGNNYDRIQSVFSHNYGFRALLGKKKIFGSSNNKLNEIIDCYIGIGVCYTSEKLIIYGRSLPTVNSQKEIVLFSEPKASINEKLMPSAFAGLRIGIGW
ncbi:MAG: hypothetical protein HY951_09015 [Bacteroidia bacterium]|nr:hypothetical protein [Bacteroidia bacterium]